MNKFKHLPTTKQGALAPQASASTISPLARGLCLPTRNMTKTALSQARLKNNKVPQIGECIDIATEKTGVLIRCSVPGPKMKSKSSSQNAESSREKSRRGGARPNSGGARAGAGRPKGTPNPRAGRPRTAGPARIALRIDEATAALLTAAVLAGLAPDASAVVRLALDKYFSPEIRQQLLDVME